MGLYGFLAVTRTEIQKVLLGSNDSVLHNCTTRGSLGQVEYMNSNKNDVLGHRN